MKDNKNRLTPEQEKGLRALLALIETNYLLLQEGTFKGGMSRQLAEVMTWLQQYHKDVKYQLPVAELKEVVAENKVATATPASQDEAKAGA